MYRPFESWAANSDWSISLPSEISRGRLLALVCVLLLGLWLHLWLHLCLHLYLCPTVPGNRCCRVCHWHRFATQWDAGST